MAPRERRQSGFGLAGKVIPALLVFNAIAMFAIASVVFFLSTEYLEMQRLENRWAHLIESIPGGVLLVDADTGVIDYVNPAVCARLGYETYELRGQMMEVLLSQDNYRKLHADMWASREVKQRNLKHVTIVPECYAQKKDGGTERVQLQIEGTIGTDGRYQYLVFMPPAGVDIADGIRTEP